MASIILTFLILLISMGGLAVGVLLGRAPIKGSCGGLACTTCRGCKKTIRGGK
ncbi:hypothetical protein BC777_3423 [Yoonia maricola]|uniref:Uncharacterized protein n=1 Tax=Yoonia maricola TaxID=420999 RepID=A0A2M8W0B8_9RHOB|nr:hypothetical protein [Yoonia maricola]PJI84365.1 hypothetical protein BC777_3423 [Yoonia maricola]